MPFDKGSVTVAVFELNGPWPEDALTRFAQHRAGTLDSIQDEPQIGWVSGYCLLDTEINDATAMAGGSWYLSLRKAERKVPATLLNAIVRREELVHLRAENRERLSGKERKRIKEEVLEQYLPKMPPCLSSVTMVYDIAAKRLYLGTTSAKAIEDFIGYFFQTLEIEPIQVTPGLLLNRDFQKLESDMPILQLSPEPGEEPTLGRDFLTWLWYLSETGAAKIVHEQYGEFDFQIEAPLTFAAPSEARGAAESTVKKGDRPQHSAEVKAAMSVGKKLRKAKLTITRDEEIWSGTFDADRFVVSSLKLPEGEELDAGSRFAERMENLLVFQTALEFCFQTYAAAMLKNYAETERCIRDWATNRESF